MASEAPAIVTLGARSAGLAQRLQALLPGAEWHAPEDQPGAIGYAELRSCLHELFLAGRPIVGLMAVGILIRLLAPLLQDKRAEPPVLAVAEDGSAVVPLLGGHRGANELARTIAGHLGVAAAITTASDARFGVALDRPPTGWTLAHPELVGPFLQRLLEGANVRLVVDAGEATWLRDARLPWGEAADLEIRLDYRTEPPSPDRLLYHPRVLALGVGTERGLPPELLVDHAMGVLATRGLAPAAVACVVSHELKAAEPAVHALAAALGVPVRFFGTPALLAQTERLTSRSDTVFRETGCYGVAEGAALAAAGMSGSLLVQKQVGQRCTVAVAIAPDIIDAGAVGRAQGRLAVVGIGPGSHVWRTAEAVAELRNAEEVVGYGLYLDLVVDLVGRKPQHRFPLGEEAARCRHALALAAEGRRVVLVSSGDAGIYAMAALVLELVEQEPSPAVARIAIAVAPGISALQAAAARVGAPLGHDFCTVSLSDLMTPWAVIEQRLRAAATGDFVTALYNPVSQKRRTGLPRAKAIFLEHRSATTPVVVARNLGRDDERVEVTSLGQLDPEVIDMLTVLLIGSRATRRVPQLHGPDRVYTPRGYGVG